MRKSARVILISPNNEFILMKRIKNGETYYTTIGGGIEPGETSAEAAHREVLEESGYTINELQLTFHFDDTERANSVDFYVAHTVSHTMPTGTEWKHQTPDNQYEVVTLSLSEAQNINLCPPQLKNKILSVFEKGLK